MDNAVSPVVAKGLIAAGYDAVHALDYKIESAPDAVIFSRAKQEGRALISLDTDFGTMLALTMASHPSVILMRHVSKKPQTQLSLLLSVLPEIQDAIEQGSIVTVEAWRVRIRPLPVERAE